MQIYITILHVICARLGIGNIYIYIYIYIETSYTRFSESIYQFQNFFPDILDLQIFLCCYIERRTKTVTCVLIWMIKFAAKQKYFEFKGDVRYFCKYIDVYTHIQYVHTYLQNYLTLPLNSKYFYFNLNFYFKFDVGFTQVLYVFIFFFCY